MTRLATTGGCPDVLARMLRDCGVVCLGEVDTVDQLDRLAGGPPDALVCFVGGFHGDVVRLIRGSAGRWFTVVVGHPDRPDSYSMIRAGADVYVVPKDPDDHAVLVAMITALVPVRPGPLVDRWAALNTLSQREREALAYVAAGYTHQQTASRMRVAKSTVDTFIARIRTKLGVGNKAELTALALFPQAVGRVPQAVGRVPQAVGRVPEAVGRVPQAVGRGQVFVGEGGGAVPLRRPMAAGSGHRGP